MAPKSEAIVAVDNHTRSVAWGKGGWPKDAMRMAFLFANYSGFWQGESEPWIAKDAGC